jgi:hypothetical protein
MNERIAMNEIEIAAVSGGAEVLVEDKYGDTMSIEDWMNWVLPPHSTGSIFDFPGGHGH